MSFSILATSFFERELKKLAKKYPSLKKDLAALVEQLLQQPSTGTPIGNDCYKIRLAITSKGKGKSGGARVITYLRVAGELLYLISIYDKSETENISDHELEKRLQNLQ